jgi:hypothetical protein
VPGLTLRDKYHIERAVGLICEGEERSTLAGFLGLADDGHLHEKALIVVLNYLDTLVAVIERLTGNQESGITGTGVPGLPRRAPGQARCRPGDLGHARRQQG